MSGYGIAVISAVIGISAIYVGHVIEVEGRKTRKLLVRLLAESSEFDQGDPTLGDRIKWMQWKVNPQPFD